MPWTSLWPATGYLTQAVSLGHVRSEQSAARQAVSLFGRRWQVQRSSAPHEPWPEQPFGQYARPRRRGGGACTLLGFCFCGGGAALGVVLRFAVLGGAAGAAAPRGPGRAGAGRAPAAGRCVRRPRGPGQPRGVSKVLSVRSEPALRLLPNFLGTAPQARFLALDGVQVRRCAQQP